MTTRNVLIKLISGEEIIGSVDDKEFTEINIPKIVRLNKPIAFVPMQANDNSLTCAPMPSMLWAKKECSVNFNANAIASFSFEIDSNVLQKYCQMTGSIFVPERQVSPIQLRS